MSTDIERLVLQIEANTRGLDRAMKRVEAQVNGTMKRSAASTQTFSRSLADSAVIATRLFGILAGGAGLRGAQQLVDSATRIENALKVAGLAGDELTAVYDRLFVSAQNNAAPLETLVQLYSRAATVQQELNVSSEELLSFTDNVSLALRVAGSDAQSASGALLQLSQALGSGTIRAEEFNSILEGALPIAQAAAAGLEEAGGSVSRLRALVVDGKVSSEAFFRAFEAGSVILEDRVANAETTVSQQFVRLQNVLISTAGKFDDVTGTSDTVGGALQDLAGIIEGLGNLMVDVADSDFAHFANQLAAPIRLIDEFKAKIGGLQNLPAFLGAVNGVVQDRVRGITPDDRRIQNRIDQAFAPGETTEKTTRLPQMEVAANTAVDQVKLSDFPVSGAGGGGGRRGGGSRSSAASAAERQANAIKRVVESLKFEQDQLGRTDQEQRLYNELKSAGVDINTAAGQEIASLVGSIETQEMAMERAADTAQFFGDLTADAFASIIPPIETGNEALDRLINSLIEAATQAAFLGTGPLASLFAGGGGGGAGGLLGQLFGGFFAEGGRLGAGQWGIAGEAGPEIVHGPANITPMFDNVRETEARPIVIETTYQIDARGAQKGVAEEIRAALQAYDAQLPARIGDIVERAG